MDIFRIIGIGIILIIPAFVGAGALWDIFHSYIPVFFWVVILFGTASAFFAWKFIQFILPSLPADWLSHRALSMALKGPGILSEDAERSPGFYVWISILVAMILLGAYALVASLVMTMEILEFSSLIPWVTLVSAYTWLVVAGSGLCIINALGTVFGLHRYERMAKRIGFLSLVSILFGLNFILFHLGRPERVLIYNIISPNFQSAISWMGTLYNIYVVFVVLELWLLIRPDLIKRSEQTEGLLMSVYRLFALKEDRESLLGRLLSESPIGPFLYGSRMTRILDHPGLPRLLGALAFITGVAALTMLGSVFAHTESRALWYGAYYPVYFLISALFTGYALLLTVTIISYGVRREKMLPWVRKLILEMSQVLAVLLAVGFVLTSYRLVSGLFNPASRGAVLLLLKGPFSPAFWIFEVGFMYVIPAFILLYAVSKKKLGGVLSGSVMVLVGAFVMRYDFIVAGQVYPNIKEGLPSYMPTLMESFLILGIFAGFLLVYTIGEKILPLKETDFK